MKKRWLFAGPLISLSGVHKRVPTPDLRRHTCNNLDSLVMGEIGVRISVGFIASDDNQPWCVVKNLAFPGSAVTRKETTVLPMICHQNPGASSLGEEDRVSTSSSYEASPLRVRLRSCLVAEQDRCSDYMEAEIGPSYISHVKALTTSVMVGGIVVSCMVFLLCSELIFLFCRFRKNQINKMDTSTLFLHFFLPLFIAGLLLLPDYIGVVKSAPNCDIIVCCYVLLIRAVWGLSLPCSLVARPSGGQGGQTKVLLMGQAAVLCRGLAENWRPLAVGSLSLCRWQRRDT
ncbi:unnamed protein product [Timema podura]|uniref:G-protein coupled receptors family 3 profile domain-containing protein n=1 Tax=Timema podura TaxID=61482 RepID=A0ABN7NZV4_TIMPD|nr:unnamed protein product [Timema podura]